MPMATASPLALKRPSIALSDLVRYDLHKVVAACGSESVVQRKEGGNAREKSKDGGDWPSGQQAVPLIDHRDEKRHTGKSNERKRVENVSIGVNALLGDQEGGRVIYMRVAFRLCLDFVY